MIRCLFCHRPVRQHRYDILSFENCAIGKLWTNELSHFTAVKVYSLEPILSKVIETRPHLLKTIKLSTELPMRGIAIAIQFPKGSFILSARLHSNWSNTDYYVLPNANIKTGLAVSFGSHK